MLDAEWRKVERARLEAERLSLWGNLGKRYSLAKRISKCAWNLPWMSQAEHKITECLLRWELSTAAAKYTYQDLSEVGLPTTLWPTTFYIYKEWLVGETEQSVGPIILTAVQMRTLPSQMKTMEGRPNGAGGRQQWYSSLCFGQLLKAAADYFLLHTELIPGRETELGCRLETWCRP